MAPPRELIDDVTAEILLRLPPDEPEHLFRAALVCKPWLRIICDPGFRPPLPRLPRRPSPPRPPPPPHGDPRGPACPIRIHHVDAGVSPPWLRRPPHAPLDCRHGRVPIHMFPGFLVWDPVTGDRHYLPREPKEIDWLIYSAAVLCAADCCDHLDCHGGPFRVVFAATHDHTEIIVASVYSSETGAWSVPVCLDNTCETYARHVLREVREQHYYIPYLQPRRGTLVGDAIYFTVRDGNPIVKYDLGKDRLSMIDPPQPYVWDIALMTMENSTSLGFACIQGTSLYTWLRKGDAEEEAAEWVQHSVIELEKTIPVANPDDELSLVGFAEGVDVIFVSSGVGLFMMRLNSGQVKKVDEPGKYFSVLPYMSFYLPETGNGGGHDAADLMQYT